MDADTHKNKNLGRKDSQGIWLRPFIGAQSKKVA